MLLRRTLFLTLVAVSATFAQSQLRCNSDDMRRHYCSVDTRGGVRMVKQHSDAACIQGKTWGYDSKGIWVDRGCRAEFLVGAASGPGRGPGYNAPGRGPDRYDNNQVQRLTCSSDDGRRHYCNADTRGGRVTMVRQRSGSQCVQGRTWGYDQRGIWVDRGCRADFEVRGGRR